MLTKNEINENFESALNRSLSEETASILEDVFEGYAKISEQLSIPEPSDEDFINTLKILMGIIKIQDPYAEGEITKEEIRIAIRRLPWPLNIIWGKSLNQTIAVSARSYNDNGSSFEMEA